MRISKSLFCFAAALSVAWAASAQAQYTDITNPGDPIELVSGTNDGDASAGAPPAISRSQSTDTTSWPKRRIDSRSSP